MLTYTVSLTKLTDTSGKAQATGKAEEVKLDIARDSNPDSLNPTELLLAAFGGCLPHMRCPLALWPEVEGATQVLLHDDYQIVIDGCKERCLLKTLEKAGVKVDLAYALDEDFGLDKAPGPDFDEEAMKRIAEKVKSDVKELAARDEQLIAERM